MSWLFWFVALLGGFVSTVSALAISAVILLVIGEVAVLLFRKGKEPGALSTP